MSEGSTLTIRVPSETRAKLDRLAVQTSRTQDALVHDALTAYVDRELATVAAIHRGRDEIRSGQGLPTDEVFRDVEAAIAEIEVGRAKR